MPSLLVVEQQGCRLFYHPSPNSRRVAMTAIQLIGTIIADEESSREYGNRVAVPASLFESLP